MKKIIAQGAEAKIFLENNQILKNRFRKSYRITKIDNRLRGSRTRREAKVLDKLRIIGFPAPKVIKNDEKENLILEKIEGKLVKDVLDKNYEKLSAEIGKKIAVLHNNGVIHGDLTTSNMIINKEIFFIDFGLSFFSGKAEDKAVDLHVLKESLESKHYKVWEMAFHEALAAYRKEAKNSYETLKRLEAVEKRGRYRAKKGN
ncbi:Kae1-associated serine/threonine protein kinase [Candidatus Woesearchaeota archaeon]|nr:Kae1-associated serine/threonine protein kinase [Candidatus Woesearchaeota archaeon]